MKNWHAFAVAGLTVAVGGMYGLAQQTVPGGVNGCVYMATPPTLTDRQNNVYTCDVNGKLRMAGIGGAGPGALMMVNGTNFVLKVNAVDHICLTVGGGAC